MRIIATIHQFIDLGSDTSETGVGSSWLASLPVRVRGRRVPPASGTVSASDLVTVADGNWATIEKSKPALIMEERQNDGSWVRQWFRALVEFPYFR